MRRIAATFLTLLLLVASAGCEERIQAEDMQEPAAQSAMMEADYYSTDPAAGAGGNSYTSSTGSFGQQNSAYGSDSAYGTDSGYGTDAAFAAAPASSGGGTTHLVAKGDTLFSLARRYYSDERRWKDIYAANGDQIKDPNRIFVGQSLVIP